MSWTDERIALLKRLWKDGKSAAEIAKALSKGVTRNAVIGKAHRMGLSGRPSPIKKAASGAGKKSAKAPKKEIKKTKKVKKAAVASTHSAASGKRKNILPSKEVTEPKKLKPEEIPPDGGVALIDLTERMCKWPIGDPREDDFTFCGRTTNGVTPYCQNHASMAYQSSSRNRAQQQQAAAAKRMTKKSTGDKAT